MSKINSCLAKSVECALKVRDDLCLNLKDVYIVTRTWDGRHVGDGAADDCDKKVYPSPQIVDLSHDVRGRETGFIKQGDLLLKGIAKSRFPDEKEVDGSSDDKKVEVFYKVGDYLYTVIHVRERQVTWDIQVRRLSSQHTDEDAR